MSEDLAVLNAARRWWLEYMPGTSRVPDDAEVLEAYAKRGRPVITNCEHYEDDRQIPCPPMCPAQCSAGRSTCGG